jgi:guanylate kinase
VKNKGKIIVFSAPSGAGKTTLLDHLRATFPRLVYSISATTRPPRAHERNGEHYYFLSETEFKRRIEENAFAEWQVVHGNYYGTPKATIDGAIEEGKHVVMDIDVYGKRMFDQAYPDAVGILILPPSMEVLEQRLRARGTESSESLETRLNNARKEMDFGKTRGKYEYTIINDTLEKAKETVVRIVEEIIS